MAQKGRYTVRLYRLHDLDLITFAVAHQFNIMGAIYAALTAFTKGEVFVFNIPPRRIDELPAMKRVYIKVLTLDMERDKDAIAVLEKIAPGCRNSFLKNLLRMYICRPTSEEYFHEVERNDKHQITGETPLSQMLELDDIYSSQCRIFRNQKPKMEIPLMPEREYRNQYTKEYTPEELAEKQEQIRQCKEKNEQQKQLKMEARKKLTEELRNRGMNILGYAAGTDGQESERISDAVVNTGQAEPENIPQVNIGQQLSNIGNPEPSPEQESFSFTGDQENKKVSDDEVTSAFSNLDDMMG